MRPRGLFMYTGQMKSLNVLCVGTLVALVVVLGARTAEATVGGPTFVGSFSYNPENESVYYVLQSQDGRGCPPLLQSISLADEAVTTELSCDEAEGLAGEEYSNQDRVFQKISEITEGFKYLSPISLSKNGVDVEVAFVESETLEDSPDFVIRSLFSAVVYQDGQKIDEFEIIGCSVDQPFSFAGYAIPGFEKKIVLLSSTKGDCWEGGYTYERLHVIGGLSVLDRASSGNEYKSHASALVPSAGTLVVFEKEAVSIEVPIEVDASRVPYGTIGTALITLLVGIFIGRSCFSRR